MSSETGASPFSDVVVVGAVRSPMGRARPDGALAGVHPAGLLGQVISSLLDRTGVAPESVDDVMVGCVSQSAEQSGNIGRMAWLGAGLPEHVPSVTIERKCGSSQQALEFAAYSIAAGANQIVVAAGVESMSRVPIGSNRQGADSAGPEITERYAPGLVSQGLAAELVADRFELTRRSLDEFSARSHLRAAIARDAGWFVDEIAPISANGTTVAADETIRAGTTADRLGELKTVFRTPENERRFPSLDWRVTAGSSSQLTDGAAAVLLMHRDTARRLGIAPRAVFTGFAVCGDDPIMMLTAPIPATHRLLERTGTSINDFDHIEVNEAFAPIPLAWQAEFGADAQRLNPIGGAIALGHPLGASGCRLLTTMLHHLERTGGRRGLQVMCEAGGMANALALEVV